MKWITALDLDRWADTTGARIALSELVSSLIRASSADIRSFRFPTGDSAQIPGYDGRLTAVGVPPYLPDGDSVWEFGVGQDYLDKANEDFRQRTEAPGAVVRNQTTFVFVTPRRWDRPKPSIEDWRNEKRSQSDWKDVRVIDGIALEDWLGQHPAVAAQAARTILSIMPRIGARSIEEFWAEYSARFKPTLTKEVLLCGREEQAKELIGRLSGEPQDIIVRADSPDEVVAFIAAAIQGADPDDRKFLEARTLVLDTEEAARQVGQRAKMAFIVRGTAVPLGGWLARSSVTIVPTGRDAPRRVGILALSRPSTHVLRDAIVTMGFGEEQAYQLARTCGRSVTVLARRIPRGDAGKPPWADGERTLIPALLSGGWNGDSQHDQAIISVLCGGTDYHDYEATLRPVERLHDPPIDREGSVWKIRAPVDAFIHLAYLIGGADLERLRAAASAVFSEYDPSLDLPEDERPFATMTKKQLRHSEWLRDGLATTLLLIAVLHEEAGLTLSGSTPQRFVEQLIDELPGLKRDYRLLASLRNELPLLMEAAPRPLLLALEQMLEGDGSAIRPIFRDGGLLGPSSPHTGLLWALEMLAWDPEYLPRVALILAGLARVDPGVRIQNRAINSLREIFLPWHPNTNATLVQRIAALDQVIVRDPNVGWDLLVMLFPEPHGVAHETAKPRYREAGASGREVLTWGRIFEGYREVVGRVLRLVQDDAARWATIIKEMHNFEPALRQRTYELLEEFIRRGAGGQRQMLWSTLQKEVNRHRAFATAEWALKEPELARLDAIVLMVEPDDILQRVAWLFNEHFPDVPRREGAGHRDAVEQMRADALQQVWAAGGPNFLVRLAESVELPQFVAIAAKPLLQSMGDYEWLIEAALGQSERLNTFALAISGEAERRFGDDWRARVVHIAQDRRWSPDQIATLLLGWQDQPTTWKVAATLGPGVDESYWRRKIAWPLESVDTETLQIAVRKYVGVGRATAALDVIHKQTHRLPVGLVFEVLDAVLVEIGAARAKPTTMFAYHLAEVFEEVAKRKDAPTVEVAKREYAMLPLLGYRERTLTLHRFLAENPEFFVSVLSDVFRPRSGETREVTEDQRARAEIGFRLLSSFRLLPGLREGAIDAPTLRGWVHEVRRLAAQADRAEIADEYIGHVLAHAPSDPEDQGWPHRVVRSLIEELASERVEVGVRTERFNMRGVVSKAMFEGGTQERALAEEARRWARTAAGWSRTAAMLHELARWWDAEGNREDERASQDQMRYE